MMNIIYAALSISAQAKKTTFSCKDDCTLTKHTGRWKYSAKNFEIPLCHIPPLRSFFYSILFFFALSQCIFLFTHIFFPIYICFICVVTASHMQPFASLNSNQSSSLMWKIFTPSKACFFFTLINGWEGASFIVIILCQKMAILHNQTSCQPEISL